MVSFKASLFTGPDFCKLVSKIDYKTLSFAGVRELTCKLRAERYGRWQKITVSKIVNTSGIRQNGQLNGLTV